MTTKDRRRPRLGLVKPTNPIDTAHHCIYPLSEQPVRLCKVEVKITTRDKKVRRTKHIDLVLKISFDLMDPAGN